MTDKFAAAFRFRTRHSSSRKPTSSTQCRLFSIAQWLRTAAARVGPSRVADVRKYLISLETSPRPPPWVIIPFLTGSIIGFHATCFSFMADVIATLTYAEGPARKSNAHLFHLDCLLDHLPALRWPRHFFSSASFSSSFCIAISAYIFLRRRFFSATVFISDINDVHAAVLAAPVIVTLQC